MFSFRKHYFQCAALFLFVVLSGCGSGGPKIVPVAGTLTHKGKPVANAIVHFTPEHGRPSSGLTDEEGHLRDGLVVYGGGDESVGVEEDTAEVLAFVV